MGPLAILRKAHAAPYVALGMDLTWQGFGPQADILGAAMARPKFTEEECKKFEEVANPHQWLLTADLLHYQALELYARREQGFIFHTGPHGVLRGKWSATNKATFLLCAFALENAIKAFLVYEHPAWISRGYLHDEICNHKLVALSRKSSLIPYARRDAGVLARFEEGNESWMRYPCSRRASDLQMEPQLMINSGMRICE